MIGKLSEYLPRPFAFGIEGRKKLPITSELRTVRQRDSIVIGNAKAVVAEAVHRFPSIVLTQPELDTIKPENIPGLYAKPARSLMYTSPHNIRHFVATDVLSLFIGKYANELLAEKGEQPIDIDALRYGAWTHDSFRTRFDILGTILNYQLHGIRSSENLPEISRRAGLSLPTDPERLTRIQEIDRYHDVDDRPIARRSREVELFTIIDKLEMVRLFHPTQMRFNFPIISQGIHSIAKKRMQAHEGQTPELMTIMGKFLPVVDGLYRLSVQHITAQKKSGKKWEEVDQYEAVIQAAKELGIIVEKSQ